jgi:hypothetical protein
MTTTDALYVYGVVPNDTPHELFAGVAGVAGDAEVRLIDADGLAAVASAVPLAEFDNEALEANLKDGAWLEQKVQAHNRVLAAAVGRATVLPFRFGAIYRSAEHLRESLAERPELRERLARLNGMQELGVKAVLDADALRARLEQTRGVEPGAPGGRAYMLRKQIAREIDAEVRDFAARAAESSHERLAAVAADARANPAQPLDGAGEMILNGAYLVEAGREPAFGGAIEELQEQFGNDGVAYELTGPWPPYNFAEEGMQE